MWCRRQRDPFFPETEISFDGDGEETLISAAEQIEQSRLVDCLYNPRAGNLSQYPEESERLITMGNILFNDITAVLVQNNPD